jgi:hypothetical protein
LTETSESKTKVTEKICEHTGTTCANCPATCCFYWECDESCERFNECHENDEETEDW